LNIFKQELSFF